MEVRFKHEKHRNFYQNCLLLEKCQGDPYREALFYALGLNPDTVLHINDLYDFQEHCIEPEGLHQPWQTSGSLRVTRLAFNLYNGFQGEDDQDAWEYTPYSLFGDGLMPWMMEAVKLRYPEYAG